MGKKDSMGLNQFNIKESLDLIRLWGESSEPSGQDGRKRNLRPAAVGALAVAVAVGVSAVVIGVTNAGVNARNVRNAADHQISEAVDNALGKGVLSQTTIIYAGASSNTEVLTELSGGTDLLILGVYGEYYRVSDAAGQIKGFVHKDYVDTGGIDFAAQQDFTPIVEEGNTPVTTATTKKKNTSKKVALKAISFGVSEGSIKVGQVVILGVGYSPTNATNKKCAWTVSNSEIAEVEISGDGTLCRITGLKAGSTVITATSVDGGHTASFTLTVKATSTTTSTTKPSQNAASSDEPTDTTTQQTDPTEATGSTTEQSSDPEPDETGTSSSQDGEEPVNG